MHGLPGFFDDSQAWIAWVNDMDIIDHLWIGGVIVGVVIPTFEWWRKYLSRIGDVVFPIRKLRKDVDRVRYEVALQNAKNLLREIDLEEHENKSDN